MRRNRETPFIKDNIRVLVSSLGILGWLSRNSSINFNKTISLLISTLIELIKNKLHKKKLT
jgi:hypothetical protein